MSSYFWPSGGTLDRRSRSRALLSALLAHYSLSWPAGMQDELFESLNRDDVGGAGCLFGISEFSVSLTRDDFAKARCLAETVQRRTISAAEVRQGLDIGTDVLTRLSALDRRPYAVASFRRAYELVYVEDATSYAPRPFRFGIALEFGCDVPPTMKCYLDLHAGGKDGATLRLTKIAGILGFGDDLERWKQDTALGSLEKCRIVGLDFAASGGVEPKVYLGARGLAWDDLAQAVTSMGWREHLETFRALRALVCAAGGSPSSMMSARSLRGKSLCLKLDVYLPNLYPNDATAFQGIERFLDAVNLGHHRPSPIDVLAGDRDPEKTTRVQQYLGVTFLSDKTVRVNIYYRPFGLETEHLGAHSRPAVCS